MDEKKRPGGQGNQGHGSQTGQQNWNQSQNPNRDPAEGARQQMPAQGNEGTNKPERARGSQNEGNSSSSGGGISNRGMDREEEQEDLPVRGSERGSDESER
jgi:hypothetical protein